MSADGRELRRRGLSPALREWMAEARLHGVPPGAVADRLRHAGIDGAEIDAELAAQDASPSFAAGRTMARHARDLEWVLDVYRSLQRLLPEPILERRHGVGTAAFLVDYYSRNRPVILEDVASGWPALDRWSPASLRDRFGRAAVEVMVDRTEGGPAAIDRAAKKAVLPFDDFVDAVLRGRGPELYLVGNNHFMETSLGQRLRKDYTVDERYLDRDKARGATCFWFGPAGTVTPLHHDLSNILFVQIFGTKAVTLISPADTHCLYKEVGVYSSVDCAAPDLDRHPRFASVTPIETEIGPGDALFIPVGWWHRVQSHGVSISLSFTNFRFPNRY